MATGKVKFFSESKGYGFIIDDIDNKKEFFFHLNNCTDRVCKDDKVDFDVEVSKKGSFANKVRRIT